MAALIAVSYLRCPFIRPHRGASIRELPFVSIIVPARDEEENIGACLQSLTNQDYHNFEIIVVDDRSTDRTQEIVREFSASDPRIKVLHVGDLPKGWTGKNHAIHCGIPLAKGELLLFIDADTEHDPNCVTASVAYFERKNLDALSLEPHFEWTGFIQKLAFSVFTLITACLFPVFLVNKKGSKLALSNGQYILIKKDVYKKVGGHEKIKDKILEDLALIENVKAAGYDYNLAVGTDIITVKMYKDIASFWQGWSRILFLALKRNCFIAFVLYVLAIISSLFPFVVLSATIVPLVTHLPAINPISILDFIVIAVLLLTTCFVNMIFRINPLYSLLHPIAIITGMAIMGNSVWLSLHKKEITWKGTTYKISSNP
jgi:chlorobactene glucosyltransferase